LGNNEVFWGNLEPPILWQSQMFALNGRFRVSQLFTDEMYLINTESSWFEFNTNFDDFGVQGFSVVANVLGDLFACKIHFHEGTNFYG
jgi:hypothetical protein